MEPPTFIPSSKPNPYLMDSITTLQEEEEEEEDSIIISTASFHNKQINKAISPTTIASNATTVPAITASSPSTSTSTTSTTTTPTINTRITQPNSLPFPSLILTSSELPKVNLTFRNYRQYPIKESAERSTVHSMPNAVSYNTHFSVEIPPYKPLTSLSMKKYIYRTLPNPLPVKPTVTTTNTSRKPSLVTNNLNNLNTSDLSSLSSNSSSSSRESSPDQPSNSNNSTKNLVNNKKKLAKKSNNNNNNNSDSDEDEEGEDNSDYEDESNTIISSKLSGNGNNKASTSTSKSNSKKSSSSSSKNKSKSSSSSNKRPAENDTPGGTKKPAKKISRGPATIIITSTPKGNTNAVNSTEADADGGGAGAVSVVTRPSKYLLQTGRCLNRSYSLHQSCAACISRYSGYTCSFINIRSFPYTHLAIIPAGDIFFLTAHDINNKPDEGGEQLPIFPQVFNQVLEESHAKRIRDCVSKIFLEHGTVEEEIAHFEINRNKGATPVRIKRDLSSRNTCDGCYTGIFSGSWLCTNCGKEICLKCAEVLRSLGTTMEEIEAANKQCDTLNGEVVRKLTNCCKPRDGPLVKHSIVDFVPFTRIREVELKRLLAGMKEWVEKNPQPWSLVEPPTIDKRSLEKYLKDPGHEVDYQGIEVDGEVVEGLFYNSSKETHPHVRVPFKDISPRVVIDDTAFNPLFNPDKSEEELLSLSKLSMSEAVTQMQQLDLTTSETFRLLWSRGEPMVVDVMGRIKLDWTPEMFIKEFGSQKCKIVSNLHANAEDRDATVGEFFSKFGKARKWEDSEKIKDWPSTSDFKSEFPKLYEDFMDTIPVPSVTRRDGVLNIAAHVPLNWNPPDLGPKGYFSEVSYDTKGGSGSTKLHMDVADATNLMFWSGEDVGGKPGTAAWDLFRAEDTELIRDFLYSHMASYRGENGKSVAELRALYDDPIHGQSVYLDADLRARLLKEKGVKPFRIWQRPGQVVFIPAGCAHQVCNYADCIKIASDFVSIENVDRCWKITEEFRHQVKDRKKLWREDVLQLKAQLYWAWRSCDRFTGIV